MAPSLAHQGLRALRLGLGARPTAARGAALRAVSAHCVPQRPVHRTAPFSTSPWAGQLLRPSTAGASRASHSSAWGAEASGPQGQALRSLALAAAAAGWALVAGPGSSAASSCEPEASTTLEAKPPVACEAPAAQTLPKAPLAGPVGLELQAPWAALILWGYKTVETRSYPLPPELIGREIFVVESAEGQALVSGVPDDVAAGLPGLRVLGTVVFSGCTAYPSREAWEADNYRHRVPTTSPYGWSDSRTIYGWEVQSVKPFASPSPVPAMRRVFRSVFSMDLPDEGKSFVTVKSRLGAPPPPERESIPLINLSPFMNGTPEEQQRVVDAVAAQCEYIGFLRVTWDGFPAERVEAAQAAARRLFECGAEEKQKWSKSGIQKRTSSYTSTGYRGIGSTENNKNRESWSCTAPCYEPGAPSFSSAYYTSPRGQQHFAAPPDPQVPWPDEACVPGFRRAICEYHEEVEKLGKVLLRIFARVLKCEEEKLLAMADKHVSAMNLFSFTMGEGGEVLPAHGDVSAFTVLSHDTSPGAAGSASLQMLTPDGAWEAVDPLPGSFLVNLGQIMQRWSNGRLRATIHRVVPPVGQEGAKRQTITFFQLLNYDASVSVLPECAGGEPKYEPLTVAEWTTQRLAGFYEPAATRDINKCWYNYNVDAYVV